MFPIHFVIYIISKTTHCRCLVLLVVDLKFNINFTLLEGEEVVTAGEDVILLQEKITGKLHNYNNYYDYCLNRTAKVQSS